MRTFVIFIALSTLWTHLALAESILLDKDVPLKAIANMSSADAKRDLELLIATLDKAYGGKVVLPEQQYRNLISNLRKIDVANSTSSDDLCDEIGKLTEQINDNHLTVHIGNRTCQRIWPTASVGPNAGNGQSNSTWSISSKVITNQNIPVLAIQKMSPSNSPEWRGFLEAVAALKAQDAQFIIDLRGNPGGDSTKGKQMAAILYGINSIDKLPMPQKTTYRVRTGDALALMANSTWLSIQGFHDNNKESPDYLNNLYKSQSELVNNAVLGHTSTQEVQQVGNNNIDLSNSIKKPVYILVDRHCRSSCELTLEALESLPNIQTVGENTTGVVQYGNVGALYLPASHIVVRIATQGSIYDDGRTIEKVGYTPMWRVPSQTDALDYTLKKFFK